MEKPLEQFPKNRSKKSGYNGHCKDCTGEYQRKYAKTHYGKRKNKNRILRYRFNMTIDEFDEMVKSQDGKCYICGGVNIIGRDLDLDHDHTTGQIRKLLCHNCNALIGYIENNIHVVNKALNYLKEYGKSPT